MKNRYSTSFYIGAALSCTVLLIFFVGCFWTPYDPQAMDKSLYLAPPSLMHPMGCDGFGRDILSRVMDGGKITLMVAGGTIIIGAGFGIIIGAVTGYFGGIADTVFMRLADAFLAFPSILMALVVIALLGTGSANVIIALGFAFIPSFARVVRSEFLRSRYQIYVQSAKLAGASPFRIIFVHILPNIKSVLISSLLIGFNNAVLAEAALSYLGLGVQPPYASLGSMLSEAQKYLFLSPSFCIFPGIALIWLVLGFGLMGDGISVNHR